MTYRIPVTLKSSPNTPDRMRLSFPEVTRQEYIRFAAKMENKGLRLLKVHTGRLQIDCRVAEFAVAPGKGGHLQDVQGCVELSRLQSEADLFDVLTGIFRAGAMKKTDIHCPGFSVKTFLSVCTSEDKVFLLMPPIASIKVYLGRQTVRGRTEEPSAPAERPSAPAEIPFVPTETPSVPAEIPFAPAEIPSVPAEIPFVPAKKPSVPAKEPEFSFSSTRENSLTELRTALDILNTTVAECLMAGITVTVSQPTAGEGILAQIMEKV